MKNYVLLAAATNGNGANLPVYLTGLCTVYAKGTWDSATAKLQVSSDDGTTWSDVTGVSFTADGNATIEIVASMVRGVVSGATTLAVLDMSIKRAIK